MDIIFDIERMFRESACSFRGNNAALENDEPFPTVFIYVLKLIPNIINITVWKFGIRTKVWQAGGACNTFYEYWQCKHRRGLKASQDIISAARQTEHCSDGDLRSDVPAAPSDCVGTAHFISE